MTFSFLFLFCSCIFQLWNDLVKLLLCGCACNVLSQCVYTSMHSGLKVLTALMGMAKSSPCFPLNGIKKLWTWPEVTATSSKSLKVQRIQPQMNDQLFLKKPSSNWGYIGWLLIKFQIKPFWTNATCVNGPVKKEKKKARKEEWVCELLEFGWQSCYGTWLFRHCTVLHSHWTNWCQVLCTNRKYLHTRKSMYTSHCWTAIHTKTDTTDAQPRLLLLFFSISRKQNVEKMQTQNLNEKKTHCLAENRNVTGMQRTSANAHFQHFCSFLKELLAAMLAMGRATATKTAAQPCPTSACSLSVLTT